MRGKENQSQRPLRASSTSSTSPRADELARRVKELEAENEALRKALRAERARTVMLPPGSFLTAYELMVESAYLRDKRGAIVPALRARKGSHWLIRDYRVFSNLRRVDRWLDWLAGLMLTCLDNRAAVPELGTVISVYRAYRGAQVHAAGEAGGAEAGDAGAGDAEAEDTSQSESEGEGGGEE